jgi:hypothetical protein
LLLESVVVPLPALLMLQRSLDPEICYAVEGSVVRQWNREFKEVAEQ